MSREHVHLIGIGGTGMAALAGLLHESGCRVTGSDGPLYPPTSTLLGELGLTVFEGFDARNLEPCPDLVVIGNAVRRGNPEAEEVLDRNVAYTSMARLIAERFLAGRHSIVIAGTHGKTTTTSMAAWLLHDAGRDPSFLVGGVPCNFNRSYRLGTGAAFVIEGDEYDTAFFDKGPKFMHYRPDTAVIGSVEFDHADIYRDLDQVRTVFARLVNIIPRRGLLVRHEDSEVTREVTAGALCRVEGFGTESGEWRATDLQERPDGTRFRLWRGDREIASIDLPVAGEYNVRNALAAAAASAEQGLTAEEIRSGLGRFRGVRRRLEVRGSAAGVTVLDDFAHHPTSIAATLRAVRGRYVDRRIWAVFEPRSWSLRRNVFQAELPSAFDQADEIVVAGVFRSRDVPSAERLDPAAVVGELTRCGRRARYLATVEEILSLLAAELRPGDVVTVMSNGAFGGLHERLLTELAARRVEPAGDV